MRHSPRDIWVHFGSSFKQAAERMKIFPFHLCQQPSIYSVSTLTAHTLVSNYPNQRSPFQICWPCICSAAFVCVLLFVYLRICVSCLGQHLCYIKIYCTKENYCSSFYICWECICVLTYLCLCVLFVYLDILCLICIFVYLLICIFVYLLIYVYFCVCVKFPIISSQ